MSAGRKLMIRGIPGQLATLTKRIDALEKRTMDAEDVVLEDSRLLRRYDALLWELRQETAQTSRYLSMISSRLDSIEALLSTRKTP